MNRAAFLDRDGVINRKAAEGEYVTRWEEMHILPGVSEAIALLNRASFRVIVVSNQRCVAKGLLAINELDSMHRRMCRKLAKMGAEIDGVYCCPHEERSPCGCRKPEPGMLFAAANEHQVDLPASWMIGDSARDVEAGKNAGCKTVRIVADGAGKDAISNASARSLLDAVHQILQLEQIGLDRFDGDVASGVRG